LNFERLKGTLADMVAKRGWKIVLNESLNVIYIRLKSFSFWDELNTIKEQLRREKRE